MATKTPKAKGSTEVRSRGFVFVINPQPDRTDGRYGVTLAETNGRPEHSRTVGTVPPERLEAARAALVDALRDSGHPTTVLSATRKKPIGLDEVAGVRAALALNAITGVSKPGRTAALLDGISRLSDEECFYWYAATIGAGLETPAGRRRLKALRIFLAQE
jgi:hypothetical protein